MHATTTKCKTIAFTLIFRAKIVGSNWLVELGSVEVNDVIKVGGIQKNQVLWQAVFLAAPPPKLYSGHLQFRQLRRLLVYRFLGKFETFRPKAYFQVYNSLQQEVQ